MSLKVSLGATHGLQPDLLFSFLCTSRPVFPDWRSNMFRVPDTLCDGQPPPWLKNRIFQVARFWILVQIWLDDPLGISSATSMAAIYSLSPLPFRRLSSNRMFWVMLFLWKTFPRFFKTSSRTDQIRFVISRSLSSCVCTFLFDWVLVFSQHPCCPWPGSLQNPNTK